MTAADNCRPGARGWRVALRRWQAAAAARAAEIRGLEAPRRGARGTPAVARGAIPAIVLTCDRYRPLTEHMILCYGGVWPSHPFAFHVPFQRRAPEGARVVPHRTPPDIR